MINNINLEINILNLKIDELNAHKYEYNEEINKLYGQIYDLIQRKTYSSNVILFDIKITEFAKEMKKLYVHRNGLKTKINELKNQKRQLNICKEQLNLKQIAELRLEINGLNVRIQTLSDEIDQFKREKKKGKITFFINFFKFLMFFIGF